MANEASGVTWRLRCLLIGLLAGVLRGVFGIGGGAVMVPARVMLLGTRQLLAHGTSLAVMVMAAWVGAVTYAWHGNFDVKLALLVGAGGVVGGLIGARLSVHVPAHRLRQLFGLLLLAVAVKMFIG